MALYLPSMLPGNDQIFNGVSLRMTLRTRSGRDGNPGLNIGSGSRQQCTFCYRGPCCNDGRELSYWILYDFSRGGGHHLEEEVCNLLWWVAWDRRRMKLGPQIWNWQEIQLLVSQRTLNRGFTYSWDQLIWQGVLAAGAKRTRTVVSWRQGFRHPTRNECMVG
jgi:hypothetical protein